MSDLIYVGTYQVVKVFRDSRRRVILEKGLSKDDALSIVRAYPDSNKHIVVFEKQFSSKKYFKEV